MDINRAQLKVWRDMTPKQKLRASSAIQNATIVDGAVISSDGVDVTHHVRVDIRPTEAEQHYAKNLSVMGRFSTENGGYVSALFESNITMEERFPSLTQSDIGRLMFIGTYTGYDGMLRHDNHVPLTRVALMRLVGLSRPEFSKFYARLSNVGIIQNDNGNFFVHPRVFQRGGIGKGYADLQRTRVYRHTVRELYDKYGKSRSVRQLGIVFAVLPFLHFNTNIVCSNPQEYYSDQVQPMAVDKLADKLKYDNPQKLRAALNRVRLDRMPVFTYVIDPYDRRKQNVIVNPRVVFAGNEVGLQHIKGVCSLFNLPEG